jgi:DNA-binding FadR family transcriptional regulator
MPPRAIEERRLYRQIADRLVARIRRGEFAVGARLPAERDLAREYRISRASVREALIALEVEGFVEVRVGAGVFVRRDRRRDARAEIVRDAGPFEVIQARRAIEPECAALAARHAAPRHVRKLKAVLVAMRREARSGHVPLRGDRVFHEQIGAACGNGTLAQLVTNLWDKRTAAIARRFDQHFDTPEIGSATIGEHEAIVDAIEQGDAAAARAAMKRHLDCVAARFRRSFAKGRAGNGSGDR